MDVPQDFGTRLVAKMQRSALGLFAVSIYFYVKYLLSPKRGV